MPRVTSPCIVSFFGGAFPLSSFFLYIYIYIYIYIYTRRKVNMGAPKTLGGITKFIKSYEEYHFSKTSCKGRGQPYFTVLNPKFHLSSPPPPYPLRAINNDWSLTEIFPRSMKSLSLEPIRPHFLCRVYQRNNLRGTLGEHHLQAIFDLVFSQHPKYKWVLSPVNQ